MIRKVSIPLVVGMIVAAGVGPSMLPSALSLVSTATLLSLYALRPGRPKVIPVVIFFLLGFFCRSSCSLAGVLQWHTGHATHWLEELVDAVPFDGEGTGLMAKALLAGRKDLLPAQTVSAFRDAGAAHVLALSGLHLGIIYAFVSRILIVLGNSLSARRIRCAIIITLSLVYSLITGAGPSIVRAFLFISLNEVGRLHPERRKDSLSVFWTALTVQLVLNPMVLDSVGFQLSYLAMLGIFTVYPVLKEWYPAKKGIMCRIWNSVALSISCQLFTAPLVLLRFGTFPKYFLLTNLIALPLTTMLVIAVLCCIILTPPGLCPAALVKFADIISRALDASLKIISDM